MYVLKSNVVPVYCPRDREAQLSHVHSLIPWPTAMPYPQKFGIIGNTKAVCNDSQQGLRRRADQFSA
jgi:hypothetical protein